MGEDQRKETPWQHRVPQFSAILRFHSTGCHPTVFLLNSEFLFSLVWAKWASFRITFPTTMLIINVQEKKYATKAINYSLPFDPAETDTL